MKLRRATSHLLSLAIITSFIVPQAAAQNDAQGPTPRAARQQPEPADGTVVTGRVERGGQPVAGVTVLLRRRGERDLTGQTDAHGDFSFPNLAPAQALIIVTAGEDITTNYVNVRTGKNTVTITLDATATTATGGQAEPLDTATTRPPAQPQ